MKKNNQSKELINNELEKDVMGMLIQGYAIIKKHLNLNLKLNPPESCEKCGSRLIGTKWCSATAGEHNKFKDHPDKEVLHKWCTNCFFQWMEEPLDKTENKI